MPVAPPPTTIFPTEERFVNVIREITPGVIPAAPYGTTFPLVNIQPEDKPIWLLDESLRGSMGDIYDFLQGPEYAEVTIPETPVYVDMIGHPLYNTLGDYTQFAPAAAPSTTTTGAANIPGATVVNVTLGTGFTVGMQAQIYVSGSTGPAEIVKVLSAAAATITLDPTTPLRLNHVAGATVTNTTVAAGTYSHAFSLLNSGYISSTNFLNFGQPPSHCWTDRTQVPTSGGSPAPSGSPKAGSIRFKLGPQIQYQYDTATASYLRSENSQPHVTDSGSQIRVVNVVVMWVQMNTGQIADAAGNTSVPVPTVTGTGNAMVLTRGVERDGTWSRPDETSVISFLDAAGKPIPFTPGNTWIHILPKDQPVYVQ